ncbi:MAG: AI-2E family transporter [Actinomycetes bacterium]
MAWRGWQTWARWLRRREDLRRVGLDGAAPSAGAADETIPPPPDAVAQAEEAERDVDELLDAEGAAGTAADPEATTPGPPFSRRSPFLLGVLAALGLFAGYGIVMVLVHLSAVITLVVVALFISLGLEPIVFRLVRLGVPRGWAVLVVILAVTVVLALLGWLIVPPVVDQVTQLIGNAPVYVDQLQHVDWVQKINERWHIGDRLLQELQTSINGGTITSVFGGVLGIGEAFANGAVSVFTVLVLSLYFVAAMPRVKAAAYKVVPRTRRARVTYLSEEITRRVGRYLIGQLCVAVINALFTYIVLIILGLPFPAVLATVVGILALVPIVGTIVGGVLVTLVALTSGWVTAAIVLGYYIAYHQFENYVLSPRIMRRTVEVPPMITIVAVLAGGALLGILGALMAIPVAAGLLLIYDQVLVPRQQRM